MSNPSRQDLYEALKRFTDVSASKQDNGKYRLEVSTDAIALGRNLVANYVPDPVASEDQRKADPAPTSSSVKKPDDQK